MHPFLLLSAFFELLINEFTTILNTNAIFLQILSMTLKFIDLVLPTASYAKFTTETSLHASLELATVVSTIFP